MRTLKSTLRFSYDPPHGISWVQEEGDLKSVEGSWTFEEAGDGTDEATYEMTVDLGRMLGMVIRGPLVGVLRGQLVESMPDKLKNEVEEGRGRAAPASARSLSASASSGTPFCRKSTAPASRAARRSRRSLRPGVDDDARRRVRARGAAGTPPRRRRRG